MYIAKDFTLGFKDPLFSPVNFNINRGELTIIKGSNGAGKSTFLKHLSGLEIEGVNSWGHLTINGKVPSSKIDLGFFNYIGSYTGNSLISDTVKEELERGGKSIGLDSKELDYRVVNLAKVMGITSLLNKSPLKLSGGEQRAVELCTALVINPEVLILDEPFSNLSEDKIEIITTILLTYVKNGTTIILSDHSIPSKLVESANLVELVSSEITKFNSFSSHQYKLEKEIDSVLKVHKIDHEFLIKDVSFLLEKGDCIHIKGQNGTGKTTLLRILSGLSTFTGELNILNGEVTSNIRNINWEKRSKYIGVTLQTPDSQFYRETVLSEVTASLAKGFSIKIVESLLECMNLLELKHRSPYTLSYGEKRRLQLVIASIKMPNLLILDEPDSGLDQLSIQLIIKYLIHIIKSGVSVVYTSHNPLFYTKLKGKEINLNEV